MKSLIANADTGDDAENSGPPDQDSGVEFFLTILDRTPPHIEVKGSPPEGMELPSLFTEQDGPKATTGDFNLISDIQVQDNSSGVVNLALAYPRKFGPGEPETWELSTGTIQVQEGEVASFIILPNDCLGKMNYSLFAWDEAGNLNPGCPNVEEGKPELCYGLKSFGFPDLDDKTDFPLKIGSFSPDLHEILSSDTFKFGKGLLMVDDNDFPNVIIRIEAERLRKSNPERYALSFPPPIIDPGSRLSTSDRDTDSISRLSDGVGVIWDDLQKPGAVPYVRALSGQVVPSREKQRESGYDKLWGNDPGFVCKNFRLEAPDMSDTLSDGRTDEREETFGARKGFGKRAVIYCHEPLVGGLEYQVSVWAEDNVKWISDEKRGTIESPYTGISRLEITVSNPGSMNPREHYEEGQTRSFWSKQSFKLVCPKPVASLTERLSDTDMDAKFPFVEAKVTDFNNNERSLKVYFSVVAEKANVRILEQKFLK